MTERRRDAVSRKPDTLSIGPSSLRWEDDTLVITLDERAAPLPRRVRGTIRVTPSAFPTARFALDGLGRHIWQPIAPKADISVALEQPALSWSGDAYLDSNFGSEPLEDGFQDWSWSRAHLDDGAVVLYDSRRRDGSSSNLALRFCENGAVVAMEPPPVVALPPTNWLIDRPTRADAGHIPVISRTLENAPFYARSQLTTRLYGETAEAVHESLSLDRFRSPLVKAMLPFRMPRRFF